MSDNSRTISDILAEAENPAYVRVVTARVLLRQDLARRHAELEAKLQAAVERDVATAAGSLADPVTATDVAAELRALEAEMDAARAEFRFRSIGRRAWADLIAKHPPTKKQAQELRVDHNPDTFPMAAMAASCVEPAGTDEDALRRLEAVMTDTQFTELWRACVDANVGGVDGPKSLLAGSIARASEQSASTAVNAGSLAASS